MNPAPFLVLVRDVLLKPHMTSGVNRSFVVHCRACQNKHVRGADKHANRLPWQKCCRRDQPGSSCPVGVLESMFVQVQACILHDLQQLQCYSAAQEAIDTWMRISPCWPVSARWPC